MRKILMTILLMTVVFSACGKSEETNSKQNATAGKESEEHNGEAVDTQLNEEKSNEEAKLNENENDDVEAEDNEFEKYVYEGAWPGIGIEPTSPEEDIIEDLEAFFSSQEDKEFPQHTKEYTFYLNNVLVAVQQRVTVDYHYRSFMKVVPQRIRNLQRLELETMEVEFIRKQYLEAMEIHHQAVQTLDGHFTDIHNDEHDRQLEEGLYDAVKQGNHLLALAAIQMVKLAEDTEILDIDELNELEDFIEDHIIKEQL
ncbi:hypothetical protein [Alkalihalobacterium chitinilyticum]|uniref:Lipoprotein n=1 Tax=Alkalihalobacterium chitinilyticum TaxID=2980103 RepID=A0ABT5VD76_9BACI|nr:hypothetical protein [Alkalihalobacterium chitinilyticum]MDE5413404.1 hypothetical protein [Alkalihalobacterium chitinilyticum]